MEGLKKILCLSDNPVIMTSDMSPARISTVVSTQWLHEQLKAGVSQQVSRKIRVLDTSFLKSKEVDTYTNYYLIEHIPQALFFGLHNCVKSTPEIPRNLPEPECFSQYVRSLGVGPETHVIAYDRFGPSSAFRTWWLFRLFGHRNVSVLDGGLKKWKADGYETTSEIIKVEPSNFTAKQDKSLLRSYEDMVRNLETRHEQVVDARLPDDDSVVEESQNGGKIPGAKHVPFEQLFNEDGTVKSKLKLSALFDGAGANLDEPLVASCLTGMMACGVAAAAHILGKDIPIYYGSWMEWRQRAPEQMKHRVRVRN